MKAFSPERWQQIEDVIDRVLDAPEADRMRTLEEACNGDVALRREVETLLRASESAGTRFDAPPLLVARDVLASPTSDRDHITPGNLIGPYRVVRLLGRGGMGAVYLAERADGTFEKNVALKIVKRGMDTDEIIHRFDHERRILARLAHPNIAGILDGGITPDGLPYFAMELAEGHPIDAWCNEHTLTIRERLRLFQTVCAAVQYAHGNLVVHRDLKPGNVLVSEGEVKLLDFGIAKLLGPDTDAPASVTQAYAMRLTPQYAAPEQIRGQATSTSADVYSLGVILYELLCGRAPYRLDGKTLQEMEQTVCTEEPMRASLAVSRVKDGVAPDEVARVRGLSRAESLVQVLRGDIDWICAKALSKTAEDRYISAAALSEDIQRYLEGRPVRAHPQLRGYRFRKFVQRNRVLVALTTITAVALMAATIITLVMFARAREASRLQEQAAERAMGALTFVVNSLSSFDPNVASVNRTIQIDDILNRGIDQLKPLDGQPKLQATVMNSLGQVALSLGLTQKADSLYGQALQRLDSLADAADFAASLLGLGEVRRTQLRHAEAETYFRRAVLVSAEHRDPRLLAQSRLALAFTLYNIGDTARLAEADSLYQMVLQTPDLLPTMRADALERLGDVEAVTRRRDNAIDHYNAAIQLRSQLLGEESPVYARGLWGPVVQVLGLGDFRRAETLARDARRILERKLGLYHRDVAWADLYLGFALDSLQRSDTAVIVFREAAMITDSIEPPGAYYAGRARFFMGRAYQRMNRLRDAERELRGSLRVYALPLESPNEPIGISESEYWLGHVLVGQDRLAEAIRHVRSAYDGFTTMPDRSGQATQAAEDLAELYSQLGQPDSAEAWRQRAVSARGR